MNSYQRYHARLHGQPVDRVPNFDILMTYAAHHIGQPLSRYYLDYRVLVEANLAALQDFHLDIVQAISDPYCEAADLGLEVEFPRDDLPLARTPLLADPEDLARLRLIAPANGRRMSDRIEPIIPEALTGRRKAVPLPVEAPCPIPSAGPSKKSPNASR